MRSKSGMRTAVLVLAMTATVISGCGRRSLPVPPTPAGQEGRPPAIEPGSPGIASAVRVVPSTNTTVAPVEVRRNPNAPQRGFILDGILN